MGGDRIRFPNMEFTGTDRTFANRESGFPFQSGAGEYIFLTEKIFINLAYNLCHLDKSFYRYIVVHLFNKVSSFQYDFAEDEIA